MKDQTKLVTLAEAVVSEIKKRHAKRGHTTGKKVWELKLLTMAQLALMDTPPPAPDPNQMLLPLAK